MRVITFFLFLSITGIPDRCLAQPVASSFQKAIDGGISIQKLDSIYKPALSSDSSKAVFKGREKEFYAGYVSLLKDLAKYLKKNYFYWDKQIKCFNRIYFNKEGQIDYFFFQFKAGELNAGKEKEFEKLLNAFVASYQFPLKADSQFAQCSPVSYAENYSQRFVNEPFPPLVAETLRGDVFKSDDQLGQVTLIHIWGFTCAACFKELPELNLLARQYKAKGVRIISLMVEDKDSLLKKITVEDDFYRLKKEVFGNDEINFEIVPVSEEQIKKYVGYLSYPKDFFLDRDGMVREFNDGYRMTMGNPQPEESENYQLIKRTLDKLLKPNE